MREGILLFGSMTADITYLIDRWPEQDTVAQISSFEVLPGGPPQNCASALIKLAAPFPVRIESALGDDSYGDTVIRISQEGGLDMSAVRRLPGVASPQTHVMVVRDTGRRTFFYCPGANALISADDFDVKTSAPARIFYAGAPGLLPAIDTSDTAGWPALFSKAQAAGYKTTIEMVTIAPRENGRLAAPCLPHLDYLVVNDNEAAALAGFNLDQGGIFLWQDAARACEILLAKGVSHAVAIHHPQGAVALHAGKQPVAAGSVNVPLADIRSAVGAGDAFSAGYHYGLHEGWPASQCLQLANAAAAASLRSMSTTDAILPASDCLAWAARLGVRPVSL